MTRWFPKSPLVTFFVLAFAFTWALLPFARDSVLIGVVALSGPAAAAFVAAGLGGRDGLNDLRRRISLWRVPIRWYVLALAIPIVASALRTGIEVLVSDAGVVRFQQVTLLALIVFVMVFGEEVGWRGFATPRLHARFGLLISSAIVGVLWSLWHLPLFFMPSMPQYQHPFIPYIGYLIALSILLGWITQRTTGSVIVATVFHGAVNTFGIVTGVPFTVRGWTNFASYAIVAAAVVLVVEFLGSESYVREVHSESTSKRL
jgi:membrane protease YdiL (CAAX protease family)